MKKFLTLSFCVLMLSLFSLSHSYAQPANDNVCDAMTLTVDAPAVTVSNIDATDEPGEEVLKPLLPIPASVDGGLCGPHGWCDWPMKHSMWFKFIAPMSTAVEVNVCGSTFDSQLAIFDVTDCSDFSTFRLLDAYDDILGCGIGAGFSAKIKMECLVPGNEYYVVVDDFQPLPDLPVDTGDVVIVITTEQPTSPGVALDDNATVKSPVCPGGSRGLIDIELTTGAYPITYAWSNGASTPDLLDGLPAGTYTLTVTDFCQSSVVKSFDLIDPVTPEALSLDSPTFENGLVHPAHCGDTDRGGQISLPMASGVNPFTYKWSTGDTLGVVTGLPDGAHTVTITDGCGVNTLEKTFYVGATAGPDIDLDGDCEPTQIGLDHSATGGKTTKYTYNIDEVPVVGVFCGVSGFTGVWSLWRTWDLDKDFGLSGPIQLDGVEVFIQSLPNLDLADGVPVQFIAYKSSSTTLDDDVVLTPIDTVTTFLPAVPEHKPYFIPFESDNLDASDILAIRIRIQDNTSNLDGHQFNFAFSEATVTEENAVTYLSAPFCFLPQTYNDLRVFGFTNQLIMNMYLSEGKNLTYNWDGNVDDATSATPMAMGTSTTTYNVTITDTECNMTYTDAVTVNCTTVGTEELIPETFAIHPNPSNGLFQVINEGSNRDMQIQVFDLQGKLVHLDRMQIGNGESKMLDLVGLAKGVYIAKFSNRDKVESYKMVIQ